MYIVVAYGEVLTCILIFMLFFLCMLQHLDYVNVMAYDVYWTGYDFSMDIEALQALGIPKERHYYFLNLDLNDVFSCLEKNKTETIFLDSLRPR